VRQPRHPRRPDRAEIAEWDAYRRHPGPSHPRFW